MSSVIIFCTIMCSCFIKILYLDPGFHKRQTPKIIIISDLISILKDEILESHDTALRLPLSKLKKRRRVSQLSPKVPQPNSTNSYLHNNDYLKVTEFIILHCLHKPTSYTSFSHCTANTHL